MFSFDRACQTAFQSGPAICSPANNEWVFLAPHNFARSCWCSEFRHPYRCAMTPCCLMWFLNEPDAWHIFTFLLRLYLFWQGVCSALMLLLNKIFALLWYCWVWRILWIFYIDKSIRYLLCKYFLLVYNFFIHSFNKHIFWILIIYAEYLRINNSIKKMRYWLHVIKNGHRIIF